MTGMSMHRADGTNMKKSAPCAPSLCGGLMMEGNKSNNGVEKNSTVAILNPNAIFLDCLNLFSNLDKLSFCSSSSVVALALSLRSM